MTTSMIRRGRSLITLLLIIVLGLGSTAPAVARPADPATDASGLPPVPKPRDADVAPVPPAAPEGISPHLQAAVDETATLAAKPVEWPQPAVRTLTIATPGPRTHADVSGVSVAPSGGALTGQAESPASVRVQILDRAATQRAGLAGVLLSAARADGKSARADMRMTVSYAGFAHAYGGDWANRLRIVALPGCAMTTPTISGCTDAQTLPTINDPRARTVTATVPVETKDHVYAVTAGSASSSGTYSATPLSPSSSWSAGGSSGDFTWSYPLRVPPAEGGQAPKLAFQYSAQSVDGRTASSNNQTSWAGEGFDFTSSYVERKYDSCDQAGHTDKFDLCWRYDNAVLVLNGKATELVKHSGNADETSTWRLKDDDGSRVQKVRGTVANGDANKEYWLLTTMDGTQYYFGLHLLPTYASTVVTNSVFTVPVVGDNPGEPCHNAAGFASSFCDMAWRWNLDYVVDPHGNAMSYWYAKEFNYYAKNGVASPGTPYVRGGYLTRIDYGQRSSSLASYKPMQVVLTTAERCLANCSNLNETTKGNWPDVPFDQVCEAADPCTYKVAPTFFTRKRLHQIKTQLWKGTGYQAVDFWQTNLQFPASGGSQGPAMWLASLSHKGMVGTEVALPPVYFEPVSLMNRVNIGGDGLDGLPKRRIGSIITESGAKIIVNYSSTECAIGSNMPVSEDTNTKRCFPVTWTPPREQKRDDWFHKYVVDQVRVDDRTGNGEAMVTQYVYSGGAAWHYHESALLKEEDKTWSEWRGYGTVTTLSGDPVIPGARGKSTTTYFRGMDGDNLKSGGVKNVDVRDSEGGVRADAAPLAGQVREQITYQEANSSAEVSGTITDYFRHETATQTVPYGTLRSYLVNISATKTRTARDGGRPDLTRTVVTDYDTETGLPTTVTDWGDSAKVDETCTITTYAKNRAAWLMQHPTRVVSSTGPCDGASANPPANRVLSDVRTLYDNRAYGIEPDKGDITAIQRLNHYDATGVAQYQTTETKAYDALGRVLTVTDAIGRVTSTTYTPTNNWPLTQTTVEQPAVTVADGTVRKFRTVTNFLPEWGVASHVEDQNGKVTDLAYDGLGRLTGVWLPNRAKATQTPNTRYTYSLSSIVPSHVRTETLNTEANGYIASYALFDSLLRPRQTQTPGSTGGRVVAESRYDSRGLKVHVNNDIWDSGAPSGELVSIANASVPSNIMNTYDGAGRVTNADFRVYAQPRWSTATRYGGDTVTVLPPAGASATTTVADIRGQVVERREYDGNAATGTPDVTRYTYDLAGRLTQLVGAGGTWTYAYDLQGRQIRSTDPDSGTTTSAYDPVDRLSSTTDSEQHKLVHSYDALDRKTALHKDSTTDANLLAEWTYDEPGLYGQQYSSTRYTAGRSGPAYRTKVLSRNVLYKPTVIDVAIPSIEGVELAGHYSTNYGYKPDAATLSFTSFSGGGGLGSEDVSYKYNAIGQPIEMQSTNAIYVANVLYSPLGDVDRYAFGFNNNMFVANIYEDGTRRLSRTTAGDEAVVSDHIYSYDPAGNVTRDQNLIGGDTQCFDYDGHRRLTQAWTPASGNCATAATVAGLGGAAPYWQSWSHTPTGLRKTQTDHTAAGDTVNTYTYNTSQPHTLAKVATPGTPDKLYGYDAKGNTTSRPGSTAPQRLDWNAEGKLTKLTEGSAVTDYIYDAEGALLVRRSPAQTTVFLGELELTLDKATRTVRGKRQYSINGTVFAVRSANSTPTSTLTWLIDDRHNTTHVAVEASTLSTTTRHTTPFGTPRGPAPSSWPENRGFLSKPEDKTTGLTTIGAREYDPTLGRFLSTDPLLDTADPQSLLAYAYANSNPTSMSDPTGLMNCDCDSSGGGGGTVHTGNTDPTGYQDHEGSAGLTKERATDERERLNRVTEANILLSKIQADKKECNWSCHALEYVAGAAVGSTGIDLMPAPRELFRQFASGVAPPWHTHGWYSDDPTPGELIRGQMESVGINTDAKLFALGYLVGLPTPSGIGIGIAKAGAKATIKLPTKLATKAAAEARVGESLRSVDDVMANPSLLRGMTPQQVAPILGKTPGWRIEALGKGSRAGQGWVLRQYTEHGNPTGLQLRWHPGGGHHGPDPYWRVIGPNGDLGGIIR